MTEKHSVEIAGGGEEIKGKDVLAELRSKVDAALPDPVTPDPVIVPEAPAAAAPVSVETNLDSEKASTSSAEKVESAPSTEAQYVAVLEKIILANPNGVKSEHRRAFSSEILGDDETDTALKRKIKTIFTRAYQKVEESDFLLSVVKTKKPAAESVPPASTEVKTDKAESKPSADKKNDKTVEAKTSTQEAAKKPDSNVEKKELTSGDEIDVPYDGEMVKFKVESINPENGKVMFSRKLEDGRKETYIEPSEKVTDWNRGFSAPKIVKRKVVEAAPETKKRPAKADKNEKVPQPERVEITEKAPQAASTKLKFSAGQTVRGYDSSGDWRIENDWKITSAKNENEFRIERVDADGKKFETVISRSELERLNKSPKSAPKNPDEIQSFDKLSKDANYKIATDFSEAGKDLEDEYRKAESELGIKNPRKKEYSQNSEILNRMRENLIKSNNPDLLKKFNEIVEKRKGEEKGEPLNNRSKKMLEDYNAKTGENLPLDSKGYELAGGSNGILLELSDGDLDYIKDLKEKYTKISNKEAEPKKDKVKKGPKLDLSVGSKDEARDGEEAVDPTAEELEIIKKALATPGFDKFLAEDPNSSFEQKSPSEIVKMFEVFERRDAVADAISVLAQSRFAEATGLDASEIDKSVKKFILDSCYADPESVIERFNALSTVKENQEKISNLESEIKQRIDAMPKHKKMTKEEFEEEFIRTPKLARFFGPAEDKIFKQRMLTEKLLSSDSVLSRIGGTIKSLGFDIPHAIYQYGATLLGRHSTEREGARAKIKEKMGGFAGENQIENYKLRYAEMMKKSDEVSEYEAAMEAATKTADALKEEFVNSFWSAEEAIVGARERINSEISKLLRGAKDLKGLEEVQNLLLRNAPAEGESESLKLEEKDVESLQASINKKASELIDKKLLGILKPKKKADDASVFGNLQKEFDSLLSINKIGSMEEDDLKKTVKEALDRVLVDKKLPDVMKVRIAGFILVNGLNKIK